MIGVVLDTNVVVSANLNDEGLEAVVVSLALSRQLHWYGSVPILQEYARVLSYPKLKFLPEDTAAFLDRLAQSATVVQPPHAVSVSKHEPDNRFLECAEAVGANFLVTGNLRHFPAQWKTTRVVNARQLLEFYTSGKM
jgi:putative PIN family toxin of toxin-antitoxin system